MLLQIDGTFIVAAISFLIFLFIIKILLYKPIINVQNKRLDYLNENLKKQENSNKKALELQNDKEEKLKEARSMANDFLKENLQTLQKESSKKIQEAQIDAKKALERNRGKLQRESFDAKVQVRAEINDIVQKIIFKILGENLQVQLNEEKIDNYLKIKQ